MSKDIRSFFRPKKVLETKIEDDDDVIPESPHEQIKKNKKVAKRKRVLNDDSDEEIISSKPKSDDKSKNSNTTRNKNKTVLKEVKPADLFGTGPIKRTQPLVQKKTETGIHSDDEFEKSLLDIDNLELELNINESQTFEAKLHTNKSPSKSEKLLQGKKNHSVSTNILDEKDKLMDSSREEKKANNFQSLNSDKKSKHHPTSEIKSKTDASKRKFAEFVDNDKSSDNGSGKKKKLNHNDCDRNTHKSSNHGNKKDDNALKNKEGDEKKSNHVGETGIRTISNHNNKYSDDESTMEDIVEDDIKDSKQKKLNKSLNESVLTDEERHERRRLSAALYKSYLNRSGPKNLGAKEIPEGTSNCLKNCAFVLTGVLDSFEKDEVSAAINKYGGCVKSGVTKKVTHVIAGEDAGPAKLAKAQELGITIINEDEFLKMIIERSKPTKKSDIKKEIKKEKSPNKSGHKEKLRDKSSSSEKSSKEVHVDGKSKKNQTSKVKLVVDEHKSRHKSKNPKKIKEEKPTESLRDKKSESGASSSREIPQTNDSSKSIKVEDKLIANTLMWVEKYKPKTVKQIIGQQGDASNVKKLTNWLTKWYANRKAKLPKPSPWAKNDDGGYYKAVLLSGPPGVGKTTTVSLVCRELGFDMVEFNASDTRNKTLIKEQIGELLTTNSLSGFARGETGKKAVTKKHVLVMDEVDGMAGNEDRGGLQELITLIKSASVPIICMCNDRNSQKMRSLVNYCYDLRFNRPRVDQIKSAMMSICFKEGIKIPPDVLAQLITSANQDVRQTLNLLSMWAIDPTLADADRLRKDAQTTKKDVKLGPWEAIRKVFSAEEHKTMSINDKSDLFFYDYSLAPLFVQENYLQVVPHCPKHEVLQRISNAADNISLGDLVDARIRGSQAWALLPVQAMYASVLPGHHMSGHVAGQIQFPGWLGKNSQATKMRRLCQEIHSHTRLSTSGSKSSIYLDYASHIRDAIVNPLIKNALDGVDTSLEVLESYHLLREDLDSLVDLSVWSGQRNPTILIDSKVKAAMTRAYNKKAAALPYAPGAVKRGRGHTDEDEMEEEEREDAPESDPENDVLIKKKKVKDAEKPGPSKEKTSKPASKKKKEK